MIIRRRRKAIKGRAFNPPTTEPRMRTSVAAGSSRVQAVEKVRFVPYNPAIHSTAVIARKKRTPPEKKVVEKFPDRLDTLQIGGKVIAKNPTEIPIQKKKK